MKVVCVHPRYLPDGFVDDVPNMQDAISALMQSRRDSIKAAKASRLPACPRLDDTQPFQVVVPSQASQEDIEDDIQKQLQIMLETDEHDVPEPAVKRRNFPGAKNHTLDFRRMLQRCDHIMESTLDVYTPDVCLKPQHDSSQYQAITFRDKVCVSVPVRGHCSFYFGCGTHDGRHGR